MRVYLFGKPEWELRNDTDVTPDQLRELGRDLHDRLHRAADVVEKVLAAGEDVQEALYDLVCSLPAETLDEAVARLQDRGIDPATVDLEPWDPDHDGEYETEDEEAEVG